MVGILRGNVKLMVNILYLSLTGMTEPLGRSQVLEYLADLSDNNRIYLVSFERKDDFENLDEIDALIRSFGIRWHYYIYSNKYGVLSSVIQIIKAVVFSSQWINKNKIKVIHARSMIPAIIGIILKKKHNIKLLFDIRGFVVDEKIDRGRLKKESFIFNVLKRLDNYLYRASDHIVTLTFAARDILNVDLNIPTEKISVIPTCANKKIFRAMPNAEKKSFKESLGYSPNDKIIIHTGTVSGWYDFDSEVMLVKEMIRQDKDLYFLVINKKEHQFINKVLSEFDFPEANVSITSSSFDQMYKFLGIANAALFFIKPSYAKQASAPTKFAENVACCLPSVTNSGVGDMSYYLSRYKVGHIVDLSRIQNNLEKEAKNILNKITANEFVSADYAKLFDEHFDKNIAVRKYQNIYESLF